MKKVREITASELARLREASSAVPLLDVRQPEEFDLVHLHGAVLIPLNEIPDRLAEIRQAFSDSDGDIVVYCRSGGRSGKACEFLMAHGVQNVVNLAGGINGYASVDSSITPY